MPPFGSLQRGVNIGVGRRDLVVLELSDLSIVPMMLSRDASSYPNEPSPTLTSNTNDHSNGDDTTSIPSTFLIRSIDEDISTNNTTHSTTSSLSDTSITLISPTSDNLVDKFEVFVEQIASLSFFAKIVLWISVPMVAKQVGIFVTKRWLSWRFGRYAI